MRKEKHTMLTICHASYKVLIHYKWHQAHINHRLGSTVVVVNAAVKNSSVGPPRISMVFPLVLRSLDNNNNTGRSGSSVVRSSHGRRGRGEAGGYREAQTNRTTSLVRRASDQQTPRLNSCKGPAHRPRASSGEGGVCGLGCDSFVPPLFIVTPEGAKRSNKYNIIWNILFYAMLPVSRERARGAACYRWQLSRGGWVKWWCRTPVRAE